MRVNTVPLSRWHRAWAVLVFAALLGGCVPAYETRMDIRAPTGISVDEGTRLAALAFQDIGFWPKRQNESAGVVVAERTEAITLGMEDMTITMQANIRRDPGGRLAADTKVTVSKNLAIYTEQQDWVDKFQEAFNKRLAQWAPTPVSDVPRHAPWGASPGTVLPTPAPLPPPAPGAREYDL